MEDSQAAAAAIVQQATQAASDLGSYALYSQAQYSQMVGYGPVVITCRR